VGPSVWYLRGNFVEITFVDNLQLNWVLVVQFSTST
jgi:hypothetical protein